MLLALATFSLSLLTPPLINVGGLSIIYSRASYKKTLGDKLELFCNVTYKEISCRNLQAFWCKYKEGNCTKLKDTNRYNTKVSESGKHAELTRRIHFEFKNLTLDEKGDYQCHAQCDSGEVSMGHFIKLYVTEPEKATKEPRNRSALFKPDATLVVMQCLILLLSLHFHE